MKDILKSSIKKIKTFLKEIRTSAGLTQQQLAKKIGCTAAHISHLENLELSVIPSEKLIRQIAEICGKTKQEKDDIKNKLLLERAKIFIAPEVQNNYLKKTKIQNENYDIIRRLQNL